MKPEGFQGIWNPSNSKTSEKPGSKEIQRTTKSSDFVSHENQGFSGTQKPGVSVWLGDRADFRHFGVVDFSKIHNQQKPGVFGVRKSLISTTYKKLALLVLFRLKNGRQS